MYVKVCGITRVEDAWEAIRAGADALGFNFVPQSKRRVENELARAIIAEVRDAALCVGVVANRPADELPRLQELTGVHCFQLHGDETPEYAVAVGALAFKAVRIGSRSDARAAAAFSGHPLLVDAKVPRELGGTGHTIDWPSIEPLARDRPLILAGGLTPENVARAIEVAEPWGVDVASGVEVRGDPRRKDASRVQRFAHEARAAAKRTRKPRHAMRWRPPA